MIRPPQSPGDAHGRGWRGCDRQQARRHGQWADRHRPQGEAGDLHLRPAEPTGDDRPMPMARPSPGSGIQQGGAPSADLMIGLGVDERLTRGNATFLTDALGSTIALASGGAIQTHYGYAPYGATQITGTASDNPYQFTGRENNGTGLYNYRNDITIPPGVVSSPKTQSDGQVGSMSMKSAMALCRQNT
jgi:hypothetical protein